MTSTIQDVLPLAPLQEGLWFHSSFDDTATDVYVGQWVFTIEGGVDADRLQQAVAALLRRNASLRAGFVQRRSGELVQVVVERVPTPLTVVGPGGPTVDDVRRDERRTRFDLAKAPLLRFVLVRGEGGVDTLVMSVHHLVVDGWSSSLLVDELFALYAHGDDLPARPPYRDFLAWLARRGTTEAEAAWREDLAGLTAPTLVAPTDTGALPTLAHFVERDLPVSVTAAVSDLATRCAVTPNVVLQAAWAFVLGRRTGRDDVVMGVTVSGRPPELDGADEMIGLFVNTVPARVRLGDDVTVSGLLRALQREGARLATHPHLPLSTVQDLVGIGRLFDTTVVFQNLRAGSDRHEIEPGVTATLTDARDYNSFALSLQVNPGERMHLELGYQPNLLERVDVESVAEQLEHTLAAFAADPEQPVAAVSSVPPAVRRRMVATWNDTAGDDVDVTLVSLVERVVAERGDDVAIWTAGGELRFRDLDDRANRLARLLVERGAQPDEPVALLLSRSPDLVVAMLASVKAGAGYVAMDPEDPAERLAVLLNDVDAALVVTADDPGTRLSGIGVDVVALGDPEIRQWLDRASPSPLTDDDRSGTLHPDTIAYVAYTSGSTGVPKGIAVSHRNVASLVRDRRWRAGRSDRVYSHSPQAFDATTFEVWVPLANGGTVVMGAPGRFDRDDAARTIRDGGATSAYLTARLFNTLVETSPECLAGLREIWTGAETASPDTFRAALGELPGTDLVNVYGPTETTVFATSHVVRAATDMGEGAVPVGRPLDHARVYVLDERMEPVAPGTVGEIYLGGPRVARGYVGRPRLTSERFVCDPFGPAGARMYRTGDLGWWHADGRLEFGGRSDLQAKIRGFRIEPAEVEAALLREHGVAAAAVVVAQDAAGEKVLHAYVVPRDGCALDAAAVRTDVGRTLPRYMIPDAVAVLDHLPLTVNGKLDRDALPDATRPVTTSGRAPRTAEETALCSAFAEVLGVETVGVDDDFFALGGESLGAIRVVNRVRRDLQVDLAIADLFARPTVAALAERLTSGSAPARPALRRRRRAAS